jgi:hypothetical protein
VPEQGSGLKKRVAGQPLFAWGLEVGGVVVVWIFYRRYQASQAAAAATGTTSGPPAATTGTIGTTATGGTGTAGTTAPTDIAAWIQQAMSGLTAGTSYTQGHFYSDVSSWLNGNCVNSQQGYNAISNSLETLGLPPGYGVLPLSLCPTSPAAAPAAKPPATGPGSAQARASYDQAINNYNAAAHVKGVTSATIAQLYYDVVGTRAAYLGQAGTPAAFAAYNQAWTAYKTAQAAHQNSVLPALWVQVEETAAAYRGHG